MAIKKNAVICPDALQLCHTVMYIRQIRHKMCYEHFCRRDSFEKVLATLVVNGCRTCLDSLKLATLEVLNQHVWT